MNALHIFLVPNADLLPHSLLFQPMLESRTAAFCRAREGNFVRCPSLRIFTAFCSRKTLPLSGGSNVDLLHHLPLQWPPATSARMRLSFEILNGFARTSCRVTSVSVSSHDAYLSLRLGGGFSVLVFFKLANEQQILQEIVVLDSLKSRISV